MTISQLDGARRPGGLVTDKEGEDNVVICQAVISNPVFLENVMLVWTFGFGVVRMLLALV